MPACRRPPRMAAIVPSRTAMSAVARSRRTPSGLDDRQTMHVRALKIPDVRALSPRKLGDRRGFFSFPTPVW